MAAAIAMAAQVRWRDGVHIVGTSIWCDAVRARDICFVSSADALSRASHGQLVGTAPTLALVGNSRGPDGPSQLSPPLSRPFSLGNHRIELFGAGGGLGAASLLVDLGDRRVVYAPAINPRGSGLGGRADVRACDELIVSAHYGHPRYEFADVADIAAELVTYCRERTDAGGAVVLLVRSTLKALDVAAAVLAAGFKVRAHRRFHRASAVLSAHGAPKLSRYERRARAGEVVLWPLRAKARVKRDALPAGSQIALVSGECLRDGAVAETGADTGFAWSHEAGHSELMQFIDSARPERVYVLHRHGEAFATELRSRGLAASALGPPAQLSLF